MKKWEYHEVHVRDFKECCEEAGCSFFKDGLPRVYKGKEFWELFEGRGHTSAIFDNCDCGKKIGQ